MHKVKHEHLPEVHERAVFPFRPSRPHSPAPSRLETPALQTLSGRTQQLQAARDASRHREHVLTSAGVELLAEHGPTLQQQNPTLPKWTPRRPVPLAVGAGPGAKLLAAGCGAAGAGASGLSSPRIRTASPSKHACAPPGLASTIVHEKGLRGHADLTLRRHRYDAENVFGHHSAENDVHPLLAHYQVPKWSTTNESYGVHYRHPEQSYVRPMRNRMPAFQIHL